MKYIIFLLFTPLYLWSQHDTIQLRDMVVTDNRLNANTSQYVQSLNDSIIESNPPLLTEILNFNTPIYFKENGYGMVSSPSFRGTTASQTAVLWNGIQVNSRFLGQTDFNTISSMGYDEIKVKAGGGSVTHGSGAIGGSIHLNHHLSFNKGFEAKAILGYGAYHTYKTFAKVHHSSAKTAFEMSYNRNSSDNDYEVTELDYKNINGSYYNHTLNVIASHQLNQSNKLSVFLEGYQDERHFSLINPTMSKTKYKNRNFKSLLQYDNQFKNLTSIVRVAWLNEKWKYYDNLDSDYASMGDLSTLIGKYDGTYLISNNLKASLISEISFVNAIGDGSGIHQEKNTFGNLGLMFSHQISKPISYEIGIRKEMNEDYTSPLLFSLGTLIQPWSWYEIKLNISRNFRAPTFNDLYWEPGGNLSLKSENSLQLDWSNQFKLNHQTFTLNLFHYKIKDMIRWLPGEAGYWTPMNTDVVKSYGGELITNLSYHLGKHYFRLTNSYAYTQSINADTDKHLSYVPQHKLNGTLAYQWNRFSTYIQGLYVGEIFTTSDENARYMHDDYQVWNLGGFFYLNQRKQYKLGLHLKNLFNNAYEAYPNRVMPPRNLHIELVAQF